MDLSSISVHEFEELARDALLMNFEIISENKDESGTPEPTKGANVFSQMGDMLLKNSPQAMSLLIKTKNNETFEMVRKLLIFRKSIENLPLTSQRNLRILKKHKHLRSESDLKCLLPYMQQVAWFKNQNLQPQVLSKVCSIAQHYFVPTGTTLFCEGDTGNLFYLILAGRVSIQINNKIYKERKLLLDTYEYKLKMMEMITPEYLKEDSDNSNLEDMTPEERQLLRDIANLQVQIYDLKKEFQQTQERVEIIQLEQGKSFGEWALINDEPRKATVVTLEDCHFCILARQDYKQTLQRFAQKIQDELVLFMRGIPYLENYPTNLILKLQPHLQFMTYSCRSNTAIKQGLPSDYVVLVREGEFEIVRENLSDIEPEVFQFLNQQQVQHSLQKQVALLRGGSEIYKKTKSLFPMTKGDQLSVLMKSTISQYKNISLGCIGVGQVFGDLDVIKKRKYSYSLKANRVNSSLYILKASIFIDYFMRSKETFRRIIKITEETDLKLLKTLSANVFSKYSGEKLQNNIRLVPQNIPEVKAVQQQVVKPQIFGIQEISQEFLFQSMQSGEQVGSMMSTKKPTEAKSLSRVPSGSQPDSVLENFHLDNLRSGKSREVVDIKAKSREGFFVLRAPSREVVDLRAHTTEILERNNNRTRQNLTEMRQQKEKLRQSQQFKVDSQSSAPQRLSAIAISQNEFASTKILQRPNRSDQSWMVKTGFRDIKEFRDSCKNWTEKMKQVPHKNQFKIDQKIEPDAVAKTKILLSKNTVLLRDKIQEYVQGFPETQGHRKLINRFNANQERTEVLPKTVEPAQFVDEKRLHAAIAKICKRKSPVTEQEIEQIVLQEMRTYKKENAVEPAPKCDYINSQILNLLENQQETNNQSTQLIPIVRPSKVNKKQYFELTDAYASSKDVLSQTASLFKRRQLSNVN